MIFLKNKSFLISLLFIAISQTYFASEQSKDYIFVTRNGKQLGPFYRQKDLWGNKTNIFATGTNNAAGFSQTETQQIITQSIQQAMIRHRDTASPIAIMINFKQSKQYSIDEYRLTSTSDEA